MYGDVYVYVYVRREPCTDTYTGTYGHVVVQQGTVYACGALGTQPEGARGR